MGRRQAQRRHADRRRLPGEHGRRCAVVPGTDAGARQRLARLSARHMGRRRHASAATGRLPPRRRRLDLSLPERRRAHAPGRRHDGDHAGLRRHLLRGLASGHRRRRGDGLHAERHRVRRRSERGARSDVACRGRARTDAGASIGTGGRSHGARRRRRRQRRARRPQRGCRQWWNGHRCRRPDHGERVATRGARGRAARRLAGLGRCDAVGLVRRPRVRALVRDVAIGVAGRSRPSSD